MAAFADLVGEELLTKDGVKPTSEVLSGKTAVGIYFSAHWCPPCRGFTPKLKEWYETSYQGKGMEIVFVSSDRDEKSFSEYYGEMPWVSVPYAKKEVKAKLDKKFKVQGIPTFVILGPNGETITTDGRKAVSQDPTGEKYPWIPPTPAEKAKKMLELLGPDLVGQTSGKHIGLYFSAHWCPPCRGFTPKLAEWYKDGLKDKMEIIFISSDRDEGAFKEYFAEMPWKALPFDKRDVKNELSELCDVDGIPSFAVLKPDGSILTTDGRSKVSADPKGETLPEGWLPQPFNDANDDPSDLNGEKCVVALGNSDALANAVKAVALEYHEKAKKVIEDMPMRFFKAPDGQIASRLRELMKVQGDKLLITDLPSGGHYYVCDKDVSDADGVRAFIAEVEAGTATKSSLS